MADEVELSFLFQDYMKPREKPGSILAHILYRGVSLTPEFLFVVFPSIALSFIVFMLQQKYTLNRV